MTHRHTCADEFFKAMVAELPDSEPIKHARRELTRMEADMTDPESGVPPLPRLMYAEAKNFPKLTDADIKEFQVCWSRLALCHEFAP